MVGVPKYGKVADVTLDKTGMTPTMNPRISTITVKIIPKITVSTQQ